MKSKVKQSDFSGKDIFVGIDVHKKQWTITIRFNYLTMTTLSIDPDPDVLHKYLTRRYRGGNYHSVYEAGFCGFWIHRRLCQLGVSNIVVNAADVPSTHKEKDRKSDRVDSAKLARELESRSLKQGIYIPSEFHQQLRSLNRLRRRLVAEQTRIKCRIKGFLNYYGIQQPAASEMSHWSNNYLKWLAELSFSHPMATDCLAISLQSLINVRGQLALTLRRLRYYSNQPELKDLIHRYLCSIPGISFVTAMTLYCELMDMKRFPNLDHLKSLLGLVPSVSNSDERTRQKGLTHRRNAHLRYILIEAAWVAVRKDPAMSLRFAELTQRMSKQNAIIRIATKLLSRIRYVWLNETPYQPGIIQ